MNRAKGSVWRLIAYRRWREQWAGDIAVENFERLRAQLGRRRIALVHVLRDVVEQERAGERGPGRGLDLDELEDFLVVDQIGVLFGLYGGAQAAFVGGAFTQGLHNIIEPLSWGLPVAFGPNLGRHWEAEDALRDHVAHKVTNPDEALTWLDTIEHRAPNQTWAQSQQGALSTLTDLVDQKLATNH